MVQDFFNNSYVTLIMYISHTHALTNTHTYSHTHTHIFIHMHTYIYTHTGHNISIELMLKYLQTIKKKLFYFKSLLIMKQKPILNKTQISVNTNLLT